MIYEFDTRDEAAALGALLVYGVYRSRDIKRFKVTPDMWGIIERAVKSAATVTTNLYEFVERLKPKLSCSTLHPRWMRTDGRIVDVGVQTDTGEILIPGGQEDRREFWVQELEAADHQAALKILRWQTARVIALVRDRLEREKPIEDLVKVQDTENEEESL